MPATIAVMQERHSIRVLCVTPYGVRGQGGIDRLYYYLRQFDDLSVCADVRMSYFAARGAAPGNLWVVTFPWRVVLFVFRLIRFRPHLVHLNFAIGGSVYRKYILLRVAQLFGARTALHFHGQFTAADVAGRSALMRCFCDLCARADTIIVLGEFYRRAFIDTVGVPAAKLAVLANGIPDFAVGLSLPKPRRASLDLLFIGELGMRKGTDLLIEALDRVDRRSQAWTCVISGNGDVARYQAMVANRSCGERVRFTGWLDAEAVHRLLISSDVVVLPSRAETLPLALLEGACAGAALVATPVGEVPEVVRDGHNGLLVEADAVRLAAAIERLIGDRDELGRMQVASRRIYVDHFDVRTFASGLCAIYRGVLDGSRYIAS